MDWFERITGFAEQDYDGTRARLRVDGGTLVSQVDGRRHRVGRFELPTLEHLRGAIGGEIRGGARTTVSCLAGDARALHAEERFGGAIFQVASQFNVLEMASPGVTPEHGVTRYVNDRTQGPACAIAAGAATIWRNYFAPVDGQFGQTVHRQIDALAGVGRLLSELLARPVRSLWEMRNGYALCTPDGLAAIGKLVRQADESLRDRIRSQLVIGLHQDIDVTDVTPVRPQVVSQAFCSALPVAYTRIEPALWEPFARLILEAAYEATLLSAHLRHLDGGSSVVLLTRIGGGAFGNLDAWIDDAIDRALSRVELAGLDVRLVSRDVVHPAMRSIEDRWGRIGCHS